MIGEALIQIRDNIRADCSARVDSASVYAGDIGVPIKAKMPCVVICERSTEATRPHTAGDQYKFGLTVKVYMNLIPALNTAGVYDQILVSRQSLWQLIEESDPVTTGPKIDTILGCLMKQSNIQSAWYRFNLNPKVNYLPATQAGDWWIVTAEITLDYLTDIVPRAQ